MSVSIKVPVFPESISEGEIAAWHKKPGDSVSQGEVLLEVETDKVVLEVQATESGVLGPLLKAPGDTVKSAEIVGSIEPQGAKPIAAPAQSSMETINLTPAVRRMVGEHEVDPQQISGTGKSGRVTKEDVTQHLKATATSCAQATPLSGRVDERVPMTRLRKTIAQRLLDVQAHNAILTTFNEVDMKPIMEIRKKYKDPFEKAHNTKLGFMSFFLKASVEALKRFPAVNGSIDGTDLVYHGYYDVGVAVSSPRGLVVPVLRNVDQMSLADIERAIAAFALKAREGSLTIEDMQGGTFTVTNGGIFGSMLSTPILNAPQSAILGMHNIVERPVAIDGEVVIRPIMYLALSYDHRMIDGRDSVSFLKTIKDLLEDPARMLLGV